MWRSLLLLFAVVALAACSGAPAAPSEADIQAAIAATQTAAATSEMPATEAPATEAPAATPTPETCLVQSEAFIAAVEPLFDDWLDTTALAGSTARIAVSPIVAELQGMLEQAEALEAPACAESTKMFLVSLMDHTIKGYFRFMAQEDPEGDFRAAEVNAIRFNEQFAILKAGGDPDAPAPEFLPTPQPVILSDGFAIFELPGTAYVSSDEVDALAEPGGEAVCPLPRGTEVSVVGAGEGAILVRVETAECSGWVEAAQLSKEPPGE